MCSSALVQNAPKSELGATEGHISSAGISVLGRNRCTRSSLKFGGERESIPELIGAIKEKRKARDLVYVSRVGRVRRYILSWVVPSPWLQSVAHK